MTKGDKFKAAAQKIIRKFSEELGQSTLYFLEEDLDESDYDTETGIYTPDLTPHLAYMAFDEIWMGEAILGNRFIALDPGYVKDNRVAYVAGADLTVVPFDGCLVTPAGETGKHKVNYVIPDQYGALYAMFITKVPTGD